MHRLFSAFVFGLVFLAPAGAPAFMIDWVEVGSFGNACDVQPQGCFGSVSDAYRIARTEVTNDQYTDFLNAVAAEDTHGLYNTDMADPVAGITRSGVSGSYTYSVDTGRGPHPVVFVSLFDTLRFSNWLHNGQPMGAQGPTTTEDGAYTFTDTTVVGGRNAGAIVFLPTEDEWFKAAYFDGTSYFDHPAGTDAATVCAIPGATPNTANCNNGVADTTPVGSYPGAPSPFGTLDQGGNALEWNETIVFGADRGLRGGSWFDNAALLDASSRLNANPSGESSAIGFRVAMAPEPGTGLLLLTGILGLARWRRPGA